MPKDEFDFEDPLELNGVALFSHEDTTNDMAECFTEEFMRMGYSHKQILALFRNPQYLGPNLALQKRGEPVIRDTITEVFARWGRPVAAGILPAVEPGVPPGGTSVENSKRVESSNAYPGGKMPPSTAGETPAATLVELDDTATDPMGAPIPKLNL
jgi:hypothetical protein